MIYSEFWDSMTTAALERIKRLEALEARVKELEVLIAELLHEYYKAKLQVIDEYVRPGSFDKAIAELDEEMAVWRERAGIKEQPPSEYEGEGVA